MERNPIVNAVKRYDTLGYKVCKYLMLSWLGLCFAAILTPFLGLTGLATVLAFFSVILFPAIAFCAFIAIILRIRLSV